MRQSEFDKITAALGRAEFAMEEVRTRADELRRKSQFAKSLEEIAALHLEAAEVLQQLVGISVAVSLPAIRSLVSDWFPIQSKDRRRHDESTSGRMTKGNIKRDWFPYAVAAAAAIVIAIGLWLFGLWGDEPAGDNWARLQESVAKLIGHATDRPSRPMP